MEELQQQERFVIFVLQDQAVMEAQHQLRARLEALLLLEQVLAQSVLLEALLLVEAQAALLVAMTQATLLLEQVLV